MQINRLFSMVYLLVERGSMTAADLAARFEVSTRTIYRDIDTLSGAGIPIYASKGKGGGIHLLPDFVLNKSLLSGEEQDHILASLQGMSAIRTPDMEPILHKLGALFGKSGESWLDVDFTRWGGGSEERERFALLKEAVLGNRVVSFSYCNTMGEEAVRRVEPTKILFKGQGWYLWGFCRTKQGFRTFKLNRMRQVEVTGERFSTREQQPLPPTAAYSPSGYEGELVKLCLKLDASLGYRVYDEFSPEQVKRLEDGGFLVELDFSGGGDWIYSFIFSFGTAAEVLSPLQIREEVAARLKKMLEQY